MDKWVALMWTVGWLLRGAASLIGLRRQTSRHYIHYAHYFNTPVFHTVMDWQVAISSSQTARPLQVQAMAGPGPLLVANSSICSIPVTHLIKKQGMRTHSP